MELTHTIPAGETFTFTVDRIDADALKAVIGYPSLDAGGPDLSGFRSSEAYPTAAIEAAVSAEVGQPVRFLDCTAHGAEGDEAYECWRFEAVDA